MSKFCNKCGTQLDDSATFCGVCGSQVGVPAPAPIPTAAPAASAPSISISLTPVLKNIASDTNKVRWLLSVFLQFVCFLFTFMPLLGAGSGEHRMNFTLFKWAKEEDLIALNIIFAILFVGTIIYAILPLVTNAKLSIINLFALLAGSAIYFIINIILVIVFDGNYDGELSLSFAGWVYIILSVAALADLGYQLYKNRTTNVFVK